MPFPVPGQVHTTFSAAYISQQPINQIELTTASASSCLLFVPRCSGCPGLDRRPPTRVCERVDSKGSSETGGHIHRERQGNASRSKRAALVHRYTRASPSVSCFSLSPTMALFSGAPVQTGAAAISAFFEGVMKLGVATVELTTDEIYASDPSPNPDSCYECARYTFFGSEGSVIDKGKYLAVLQQERGQWRYAYDMFSSNGPIPPM